MDGIECYLSRRRTGVYILTQWLPEENEVGDYSFTDLYALPGDPLAWFGAICPAVAYRIVGRSLRKMETIPVTLSIQARVA